MITRIVKMTFREEEINAFQTFFEERRHLIRSFEGCTHLELWQDKDKPAVFFTYSRWHSVSHLNAYRASAFFADTWTQTKEKFAAKPEAWTVEPI